MVGEVETAEELHRHEEVCKSHFLADADGYFEGLRHRKRVVCVGVNSALEVVFGGLVRLQSEGKLRFICSLRREDKRLKLYVANLATDL